MADPRFAPLPVCVLDTGLLADDPRRAAEAVLSGVESRFPVRVTIHDRSGVFHHLGGGLLGLDRTSHQHPFCKAGRPASRIDRCLAHCQDAVNAQAASAPQAFVHRCWKGGREVVVPLWRHGVHLATLFAGPLRPEAGPPVPTCWRRLVQGLPAVDETTLTDLATALAGAGDALLATAERLKACEGGGSRAGLIRRFLHYHAHRAIGLEDLARHLGLSPWHCSRVASRVLGRPFGEALTEERLQRATGLLRATDQSVGAVAHLVGFASQHHFNRAFKARFGIPPGRWRHGDGKGVTW